jgi:hypothetical protein
MLTVQSGMATMAISGMDGNDDAPMRMSSASNFLFCDSLFILAAKLMNVRVSRKSFRFRHHLFGWRPESWACKHFGSRTLQHVGNRCIDAAALGQIELLQ